jgi:acetolactate synthase-1/2/3 large subunit
VRAAGDPAAIAAAADLLLQAERPYVYAGAGVLYSEATPELVALAEELTLPVATTLNGKSAFPEDHPLSLGIGGFARALYGSLPATAMAEEADVILTLGCGFKKHTTRRDRPAGSRHIQVDVDAGEINKHHVADVPILGDARLVLAQLLEAVRARGHGRRRGTLETRQRIVELRTRWDELSAPLLQSNQTPVNPFRVTHELAKALPRDRSIVLHDAGSVRGSTCQHYPAVKPRSFIGFGVQSAMGWSIGAAIGAKVAEPGKIVCAVIGEEAFNETAMDIETSVRGRTPVLIVVKNNRAFADRDGGNSQKLAKARFHEGVDIGPLATALGARAFKVTEPSVLAATLAEAIATVEGGRTAVLEVQTTREKASLHRLWDPSAK